VTAVLVTGATGQDGSYLCERLAEEGATVHAVVEDADAAAALPWLATATLHQVDLRDSAALREVVLTTTPGEVYNLAGLSSVGRSWNEPVLTAELNAVPVAVLLAAVREVQQSSSVDVRFVQASSAEIFGDPPASPQDEGTPVEPTNPYGAAKAYAHHMVAIYRSLGLHASSVVLYNHESPRRPPQFVTRKITAAVARIALGHQEHVTLGTLATRRDWGWAPDYVDGMVRAARHDEPLDVVLATGRTHTIGEFADAALHAAGVEPRPGLVRVDAELARPTDATEQCGDASLARTVLGWVPSIGFEEIVRRMVVADLALLADGDAQ